MDELTLEEIEVMLPKARADGRGEDVQFLLTELDRIEATEGQGGQPQPAPQPTLPLNEQNNQAMADLKSTIKSRNTQVQTTNKAIQEDTSGNFNPISKKLFSFFSDVSDTVDTAKDVIDVAPTIATGAVADSVGGLTGLGAIAGTKIGNKLGLTDADASDVGEKVLNSVKDFISIKPDAAAEEVLINVAKTVQPLTDKLTETSEKSATFYGDIAADWFGEEFRASGQTTGTLLFEASKIALETLSGGATGKVLKAGGKNIGNKIDDLSVNSKLEKDAANFDINSENMKTVVSEQFEAIRAKDINFDDTQIGDFKKHITENLKGKTVSTSQAKKTVGILQAISKKIKSDKPINVVEFQDFRSELGTISRGIDTTDAAMADRVINSIDNTLDKVADIDYRTARRNDVKRRKIKQIEAAVNKADLTLDADDSTTFARALKTPIKGLIRKDIDRVARDQKAVFNPKETKVIQKLSNANDTTMESLLGIIGRMNPKGIEKAGNNIFSFLVAPKFIGQLADNAIDGIKRRSSVSGKKIIAAGDNANDIIKAYYKNTPKKLQSNQELTALLLRDGVKGFDSAKAIDKTTRQSIKSAKDIRGAYEAFQDTNIKTEAATVVGIENLFDDDIKTDEENK